MQTLLLGPLAVCSLTSLGQKASALLSQASVDVHTETVPVPSSGSWGRCIPVPVSICTTRTKQASRTSHTTLGAFGH